jgi:hypothetical protein
LGDAGSPLAVDVEGHQTDRLQRVKGLLGGEAHLGLLRERSSIRSIKNASAATKIWALTH